MAYLSEAEIYNDFAIQPLTQTIDEIKREFDKCTVLKCTEYNKIIGSVRAYSEQNICYIGKLIVHPEYQNKGLGTKLMNEIEKCFPDDEGYKLFTGYRSEKNIHLYTKLGYQITNTEQINEKLTLIRMEKVYKF